MQQTSQNAGKKVNVRKKKERTRKKIEARTEKKVRIRYKEVQRG